MPKSKKKTRKKTASVKPVLLLPATTSKVVEVKPKEIPPPVLLLPAPKPKRRIPWKFLFFIAIFLVGLNLLILGSIYQAYRRTILSFQVAPVSQIDLSQRKALPINVAISSQGINLPIDEAAIVNGIWQTSSQHPTHLNTSARPGEDGNVVIYGHNLLRIFGKIRGLKSGDIIDITTADHKIYEYIVSTTTVVQPNQVDLVLPTNYEVLTMYTCTGFLDSKRFVVQAKLASVKSL